MEYLVDMTTQVPARTSPETVDDMRARESKRAAELAAAGHLLRLWRPPLAPGQWRTFGLFAAQDAVQLEMVLASMPLRIWRTDLVTPLTPHPNDPHGTRGCAPTEFLTWMNITVPAGTPSLRVGELKDREAVRARELAGEGHLLRLWRPPTRPDQWRTLGLWSARDDADLSATMKSLPLHGWMDLESIPLSVHPNDPAQEDRA
ncbi:muconolactone Delta-isomerase family protein [Mycolicibacterium aubagnense]|uniref:Muconolactone isomerase n=1 Tax=Mycolicibacterium aubagnense TaxID=319707 RepID=A0ABN5YQS5_9MYCO|nr:muconolactone Delta-isomerase family protein [Mycolicibacterium aubagnense]TLH58204.1 muconolactone delta-isomerase [Mycolicibacterium aubagnense]WGI34264.1 muconolactone Delta-isomerase family protein [Mycolicibacterium aubagnense]BBX83906.1 muconolactone isomerase [Mycolicibacterium aubagnense]